MEPRPNGSGPFLGQFEGRRGLFKWLRSRRPSSWPLTLVFLSRLFHPSRAAAESGVEYRYEDYSEDDDRMHIRTHTVGFNADLGSRITARGMMVYDGISGATPTGELPALSARNVPRAQVEDIRRAATIGLGFRYGIHRTSPEFSYSEERDYRSRGFALTHSMDFNQKNTTLVLGAAHNSDEVGGGVLDDFSYKRTTDLLIGLNQLLSPSTVLSVNLSFGYADGYLNDPYRLTTFFLPDAPDPNFFDPGATIPVAESRPRHRFKQMGYLSLTQFITPLNASVEGNYRLHHDDWGIWANTVSLTWFQKLGRHFTLAPTFRYYWQGAADFYSNGFRGVSYEEYASGTQVFFEDGVFAGFPDYPDLPDPAAPGVQVIDVPGRPSHYSSDYRLSQFEAFTFGIGAQIRIADHFRIEMSYKRYEMHGLDGATPSAAYPSAHIFSIGCGVWF